MPTPSATRPKGEGQWALGHREPLNANERIKKDDDGLNVRARIETIYAKRGFASIDPQRPARPVPLVGPLHPAQARASTAAARPRSSRTSSTTSTSCCASASTAASCRPAQLRAIAAVSERVRPRHRRHHRPAERPAPLDPDRGRARDLAAARGGRPVDHRGVRRHPARRARLPGRRDRRRRDHRRARPPIDEIVAPLHRRPGALQPAAQVQDRDHRPARARTSSTRSTTSPSSASMHPEHGPGFDLWVGGGLSTNPMLAQRLGVWVPLDEVRRRLGRRGRDLPRLRLPAAAHQGPAEVPASPTGASRSSARCCEDEYLGARCSTARPRPRRRTAAATTSACTRRRTAASTSASPRSSAGSPARILAAARRPRRGRTARPRAAHRRTRSSSSSTSPPTGSTPLVARARRARPLGPPVGLPARHDGLHRHRVLQARHRRDQGHAPPTLVAELEERLRRRSSCRTDHASTSTAAPTRAPASRSPTSASRASCADDRRPQRGSRLSRCTSAAGSASCDARRCRGSAARVRGAQACTRRRRRPESTPSGSCAPTIPPRSARMRGRRDASPHWDDDRAGSEEHRLGVTVPAPGPPRSRSPGAAARASCGSCREPATSSAASPSRLARPRRRRGPRVGAREVRRPPRRGLLDGRRGAAPTWRRRAGAPGRRRAVPRHRLPLRRDLRHPRRGRRRARRADRATCCRDRPSPSRTPRTARRSSPATRTCAARCARSSRCERALAATTPGSPACAATRPPPARTIPVDRLGRQAQRTGQDQPAGRLDSDDCSRPTPPTHGVLVNPLRRATATRRSAARRAPGPARPARTRAPAAGPAWPRPNAGCTHERRRPWPAGPHPARRPRVRGDPHHPRGGRRVRAAGAAVLRRQGLHRHAAPGASRRSGPAPVPFPLLHVDTGHNFPEVLEFRDATVERLGPAPRSSPRVQDYIDDGRAARARPTAPATRCRPCRCSTRSPRTASTPSSAAAAATRRRRAPRSGSSRLRDEFGAVGPAPPAARAVEPLQRPARARASTCASSRSPTGPSSTSGATSSARRSTLPPHLLRPRARGVRPRRHVAGAPASGAARATGETVETPVVRYRTVGDMSLHRRRRVRRRRPSTRSSPRSRASRLTERGATRADDRISEAAMEDRKREGYF